MFDLKASKSERSGAALETRPNAPLLDANTGIVGLFAFKSRAQASRLRSIKADTWLQGSV